MSLFISNRTSQSFLGILLVVALASTLILQTDFQERRYSQFEKVPECPWCENNPTRDDSVFIPLDAPLYRIFSPADSQFLADVLWMKAAYYFGQHMLSDRKFPYLFHMLELITDMASQWLEPFLFGSVVFTTELDQFEDAMYFVEKGLAIHPDEWQLWFFKGYYEWKYLQDLTSAAASIHKAGLLPDAPAYLSRLSATLATRAGQKELAARFLNEAIKNVRNEIERKLIEEKLREILQSESTDD